MKIIECKDYNIYINDWHALKSFFETNTYTRIFVIVDENTEKLCLYMLLEYLDIPIEIINIPAGEHHKNIKTCQLIWDALLRQGADRHSIVVNLGGGVVGDMGGFAAATYMRGLRYIQIPTTLLSQVDASIGGKLGVDYNGFKNIIGTVTPPIGVFIFTDFLSTLPFEQFRSGYAELLKHGLIADKETWCKLSSTANVYDFDIEKMVWESVKIKKEITEQDPNEKGLRKILNFGHTIGHAVEAYWMDSRTPLLHGDAVAIGMVSEAFLSYRIGNISETELFDIRNTITRLYGHHPKYVKPTEKLMEIMKVDKKNYDGSFRFSLLDQVGKACYDIPVSNEVVEESFMFYEEKYN